ncbi:dynein intermediate chain 1, axonemal-like [Penaeus monodon]|uniref:dynein intermediate chain 1, axonemal-like n=1 Tax=Penaeus monodon TaxID=6687 RepID=UPI0018A6D824|nr:dynein intermediate chain 1, axonemal-like [Penaeus monodon]
MNLRQFKVKWIWTQPREEVCLFSSALDGRVTQWHLHNNSLVHINILDFKNYELLAKPLPPPEKITLEGLVTCIAFCPNTEHVILVGVDTGALYQCSIVCSVHTLVRYSAHTSPVRGLAWNSHHSQIFLSCSVDWTVKVWLQHKMTPLIILDLGAAVAAVTWSPYSSSVFVAVTDDGRVHVYDLFVRKCKPLCVQTLVQRRRVVTVCVAFNPFHPIILVGGEKGYLASLKLSPNLRRSHRDSKGPDPQDLKEIELCKMERLIATSNKD